MNAITAAKPGAAPDTRPLHALLSELEKFGYPRIFKSRPLFKSTEDKPRWQCVVDMNTSADGAEFKISSEYHYDPQNAAAECLRRAAAAARMRP